MSLCQYKYKLARSTNDKPIITSYVLTGVRSDH